MHACMICYFPSLEEQRDAELPRVTSHHFVHIVGLFLNEQTPVESRLRRRR